MSMFEQTPGDREGQDSLACCSPWGCKELDMSERLKDNKKMLLLLTLKLQSAGAWALVDWPQLYFILLINPLHKYVHTTQTPS